MHHWGVLNLRPSATQIEHLDESPRPLLARPPTMPLPLGKWGVAIGAGRRTRGWKVGRFGGWRGTARAKAMRRNADI